MISKPLTFQLVHLLLAVTTEFLELLHQNKEYVYYEPSMINPQIFIGTVVSGDIP